MSDVRYAYRFRGQRAVLVAVDVDGEPHMFQRLAGLPDFDLGVIPEGSPMRDGPPAWNPLVEVATESEL